MNHLIPYEETVMKKLLVCLFLILGTTAVMRQIIKWRARDVYVMKSIDEAVRQFYPDRPIVTRSTIRSSIMSDGTRASDVMFFVAGHAGRNWLQVRETPPGPVVHWSLWERDGKHIDSGIVSHARIIQKVHLSRVHKLRR